MRFDENGRLSERQTRTGQSVKLSRDPYGKLVKISDQQGRGIQLTWANDRIVEASDVMGRKVLYRYTNVGSRVRSIIFDF